MKTKKEMHRYETEIFLSLLADYPDYFFVYINSDIFDHLEKEEKLIKEVGDLKKILGLSIEQKNKIDCLFKKMSNNSKIIRLNYFYPMGAFVFNSEALESSKDLFMDGAIDDLIFLIHKEKFLKTDVLIRDIIFSIIEVYVSIYSLAIVPFELEVILKSLDQWSYYENLYDESSCDDYDEDEDENEDDNW